MFFNQTISTSTETCLAETSAGFCSIWQKEQTVTVGWASPIYLALKIAIGFFIIFAVIKMRFARRKK